MPSDPGTEHIPREPGGRRWDYEGRVVEAMAAQDAELALLRSEVERLREALGELATAVEDATVQTYRDSWGSPAEKTHLFTEEWQAIVDAATAARLALAGDSTPPTRDA